MPVEQHAIHIQETTEDLPPKFKKSHYAIGSFLILLGILFIFKKVGLIEITWPLILMATGFVSLVQARLNRSSGGVSPGIFLVCLGLIFLADGKNWIEGGVTQNWPLVILALSLSFLGTASIVEDRRKHWSPGLILLAFGGFLLVVEYGWIKWGALNEVLSWWPILLIIAGIWFMFRKKRHKYTD